MNEDLRGGGADRPATILVVDDVETNRELLLRALRRRGFLVELAADGPGALALVDQRGFDLVLLDIMMPGMDGLEVLGRIRERHPISELPVIMVTAKDSSEDVVRALQQGANDYVTKPINLAVTVARIQTQLGLRRAHRQISDLARQLEARNRFIQATFGRYLTDEVVESLLESPDGLTLGGETRVATILMSDLRGFSALAERLSPERVISLLNHYLGAMTEIICAHGGTIDEFIGDAILVIFGAPTRRDDDALRAVSCAVQMQLAMEAVNAVNLSEGLPRLEMGIGINTGEVVVGNIGSVRRAKYGVVGRHVNLASRIEAYTIGEQILVSDSTLRAAGEQLQVEGSVEVFPKGSRQAMRLHSIVGVSGEPELRLPRRSLELQPLGSPLPVKLYLLDGIQIPGRGSPGALTHLAAAGARITTEARPGLLSTIKIELEEIGEGDLYAKVVSTEDTAITVRFTSVALEVEGLLSRHRE
jgi:class 3 adenylate cyclase/ActR/RegA family two-component response regulator